jgi:hypothetical protein
MAIIREEHSSEKHGIFLKTKKPGSGRHLYAPEAGSQPVYGVELLEVQHPEKDRGVGNRLVKVKFISPRECARFIRDFRKQYPAGDTRDPKWIRLHQMMGQEHMLISDAPASMDHHLTLMDLLEKGLTRPSK